MSNSKQPDPLYDQLMNYEIGFDEFVEGRKQQRLKGNSPMKVRPTAAQALVAAAKASQGLTVDPPADTLSPEYLASLEASAAEQASQTIDAEFTELAEANALNADDTRKLEEDKRKGGLFDRIWFTEGPPPQDVTEMGLFQLAGEELAAIGQHIVDDVRKLGNGISNGWIAAGAQIATWSKTMTLWSVAELSRFDERRKTLQGHAQRFMELRKDERRINKAVTGLVFEEFTDYMLQEQEKLRNEFVGRITALEKAVKAGFAPAPAPDYSKLDTLLDNIADGKLINATKLYREIKGCSLVEAKDKIQRLVVPA